MIILISKSLNFISYMSFKILNNVTINTQLDPGNKF